LEFDGATADNLIAFLMAVVGIRGDLDELAIVTKLICFEADGVSTFQGCRTRVTIQLKARYTPHITGIHCMGH